VFNEDKCFIIFVSSILAAGTLIVSRLQSVHILTNPNMRIMNIENRIVQNHSALISIETIAISLLIIFSILVSYPAISGMPSASALTTASPQKRPQYAASGDNVYAIWFDINPDTMGTVLLSRSTDGGVSFTGPKKISDGKGMDANLGFAASGNNVYIVWSNPTDFPHDTYFMRSTDAGDSFEAPVNLSMDLPSSSQPQIAVHENNVYVSWISDGGIFGKSILVTASKDYGKTFDGVAKAASSPASYHYKLAGFNDSIYLSWIELAGEQYDVILAASSDRGETFHETRIDDPEIDSQWSDVFATEKGVYVAYFEFLGDDPDWPDRSRVMLRTSEDNGRTFSPASKVSGENPKDVFSEVPVVFAAPNSNGTDTVFVIWRDGSSDITRAAVRASSDGAKTFGQINTLSNITHPYIEAVAVKENEPTLYVAWTNSVENAEWEMFVGVVEHDGSTRSVVQLSDSGKASDPKILAGGDSIYAFWTDWKYNQTYGEPFFAIVPNQGEQVKNARIVPEFQPPVAALLTGMLTAGIIPALRYLRWKKGSTRSKL
jgi:hypothetical protein